MLPLVVFATVVVILYAVRHPGLWEAGMLLPAMNGIGLVASLTAVGVGAFGFMHDGSPSMLTLTLGVLIFGLAGVSGSALLELVDVNSAVTAHNTLSIFGGLLLVYNVTGGDDRHVTAERRGVALFRAFAMTLVIVIGLVALAAQGLLPRFIWEDGSSTNVRTLVLGAGILAFVIAATAASQLARVTEQRFMRLYSLGLAFIALGLIALSLGRTGSLESWAGRSAQLLGQLYIVVAVLVAVREPHSFDMPAGAAIAESFKRVQDALGQSRAQLEAAVESMNDAVFITDAKGDLTTINSAFVKFHKFERKETVPRKLSEYPELFEVTFIDGTPAPTHMWMVSRALRGEVATNQEYILRRKDTGEAWVGSFSLAPIRDERGQLLGSVVVGRDVTANKLAEEREREDARVKAALVAVDALVHSSFNRDTVFDGVLPEAVRALEADSAAVVFLREGNWLLRHTFGIPDAPRNLELSPEDVPLVQRVANANEIIAIGDTTGDDLTKRSMLRTFASARAMILAPIVVLGEVRAVITLNFMSPHQFTETERWFAERLAASLGLSLANIELYDAEHAIAETLQETLIVVRSRVPGIDFSRSYKSASYQAGSVGGDFVDVFEVGQNLVGLSLGDVSGKGIDAAVTTSLIRNTLRVHALDGLQPDAVVEKANNVMRRFVEQDSFVTLWFGLLNTSSGVMKYVCAGHPPALIVKPDGLVIELACVDPFLGVFGDAKYELMEARLRQGDRLVVYSDGAIEAREPGGEFLGEASWRAIVARHRGQKTADLSSVLMGEVMSFSEGILRDDAAILVVEPVDLTADGSPEDVPA